MKHRTTFVSLVIGLALCCSSVLACIPLNVSRLQTHDFNVSVSFAFAETPDFEIDIESMTLPTYPTEFLQIGISGYAVIEFKLTAAGEMQHVRVFGGSHTEFEAAALNAVRSWSFSIGDKVGTDPAQVRVRLRFEVTEKEKAEPGATDNPDSPQSQAEKSSSN